MNKITKMLMTLGLGASLAFGAMGIAACTPQQGKSAYEIAVEHGFEGTEEEWLESLKGNDAKAPEITIGENGNWYINGTDTGIKATGADGAQGPQGQQGQQGVAGARGSKWFTGEGDPEADLGIEDDMYLDTKTGNIWQKGEKGWLCVIDYVTVNLGTYELTAEEPMEVPVNVDAGLYTLNVTIKSETTPVRQGLMAKVGDSVNSYDLFEATDNCYTGVIIINESDEKVTFTATEDMEVSLSLTPWESPVLKADGQEYLIPSVYMNPFGRMIPINVDPSLNGQTVKVTLYNIPTSIVTIMTADMKLVGTANGNEGYDEPLTGNLTFNDVTQILISSMSLYLDYNVRIKIEPIE